MDEVIKKAEELADYLKNRDDLQEFLKLKQEFENNAELAQLRKDIALAKKENRLNEHAKLKQMYDNHPLVVNYYSLKDDIYSLLGEISKIVKP